jgi:hypothetical protein
VNASPSWLPPDAPQVATCRWTDAKAWTLTLGVVIGAVTGPQLLATRTYWPLGVAVLAVVVLFCFRVLRAQVVAGPDGFHMRGIVSSTVLPWSAVSTVEAVNGPGWLALVSGRALSAKRRTTLRAATATAIRLRNGSVIRPLALTRSLPSRRAEEWTRLAQQFLSTDVG